MLSKSKGTFRCNTCCSRITQLNGVFGTWPTHGFKAMTEAEQFDFFSKIGKKKITSELEAFAKESFESFSVQAKTYYDGGNFVPLSVWETLGYDADQIRTNSAPEDRMTHPVLGDVYRVSILCTATRGETGSKTATVAEGVLDRREPKQLPAPAQAPRASGSGLKRGRFKPRLSSSSSSSSNIHHKRRKDKTRAKTASKGKKHAAKKEDDENRKKFEERATAIEHKKTKAFASKVASRVLSALPNLEASVLALNVDSLPPRVRSSVDEVLKKLRDTRATIDDPGRNLEVTADDVATLAASAKKANVVIASAMASIARIGNF